MADNINTQDLVQLYKGSAQPSLPTNIQPTVPAISTSTIPPNVNTMDNETLQTIKRLRLQEDRIKQFILNYRREKMRGGRLPEPLMEDYDMIKNERSIDPNDYPHIYGAN